MIGKNVINEGDWLSLNGSTGEVILGKQPLSPPALSGDLETFMSWADEIRNLRVTAICFFNLLFYFFERQFGKKNLSELEEKNLYQYLYFS